MDFLISGDVSRKGDKILATLRLDEAAHGVTVFSRQYEVGRDELLELPERIGAQMAGSLTWSFPMMLMDRRRPLDPALMAELLQGETGGGSLQAYQIAKRAVAKSPDYVATQVAMAFSTAFALSELPNEERAAAVSEARRAAERAIELQPGYGDTYGNWCLLHSETRRAECEDRLRAGRRKDPDAPFLNTFLSHLMRDVGRYDELMDLARLAHTHDVYFPTKIAWMLKTFETAGEVDEARDLYRQGARWWPDFKPMYFRNRLYGLVAIGDFQGMVRLEREVAATKVLPDYQESGPLAAAVKSKSIAAARRACPKTDSYYLNVRCMIALAIVGDQNGAYAIADQLYVRRLGRTPAETEQIWLKEPESPGPEFITSPAAAAMRRDPRFLQLADRIGLLAYWRSDRRPDFCREQPEPICRQLFRRK